jgi:replicative DNA helicase
VIKELIDLPCERSVLAGVFKGGEDTYLEVAPLLIVTSFADQTNRSIWRCIEYLYNEKGIKNFDSSSTVTALSELGFSSIIDRSEEMRHLSSIFETRIDPKNVVVWARRIRKLEIARELYEALNVAQDQVIQYNGSEGIETVLSLAESTIFNFVASLGDDQKRGTQKLSEGVNDYMENIRKHPNRQIGISSGWSRYDQVIGGGFRRKTVSLLGARPGIGKSMAALNIALSVAESGIPVLFLDTEMDRSDHQPRALSNLCRKADDNTEISITAIEKGVFVGSEKKEKEIEQATKKLEALPFFYESLIGVSFEETLPIMRRWIHKNVGQDENGVTNDCLIVYDYIKLQNADKLTDTLKEFQILGFMATAMHNFAGHFDIPIFATIQLNRDEEIAQSDRIYWLVTSFAILKPKHNDEILHGQAENNLKITPQKTRHGEGVYGTDYINLRFYKRFGLMLEGELRSEVEHKREDQVVKQAKQIDGKELQNAKR